jgi:hypothetical protein
MINKLMSGLDRFAFRQAVIVFAVVELAVWLLITFVSNALSGLISGSSVLASLFVVLVAVAAIVAQRRGLIAFAGLKAGWVSLIAINIVAWLTSWIIVLLPSLLLGGGIIIMALQWLISSVLAAWYIMRWEALDGSPDSEQPIKYQAPPADDDMLSQ